MSAQTGPLRACGGAVRVLPDGERVVGLRETAARHGVAISDVLRALDWHVPVAVAAGSAR